MIWFSFHKPPHVVRQQGGIKILMIVNVSEVCLNEKYIKYLSVLFSNEWPIVSICPKNVQFHFRCNKFREPVFWLYLVSCYFLNAKFMST